MKNQREETETWWQEIRARRQEIAAKEREAVTAAVKVAERALQDKGEGLAYRSLFEGLARKVVALARRRRSKPFRRKDIFETGLPNKQVEIHICGRQGVLAGEVRARGKLLEIDGNHVIIRIPKSNVLGWEMKGGAYRKRQRAAK